MDRTRRVSVNEESAGASPAADDYDLLPYPSMPYTYTQPARLAAVAALYGIGAPAAAQARVLELGCASGGNIIPLAARYPHARFLGIDLASRHVEEARRRIAELGLTNIEVRQGDLAELSLAASAFDYIICHGVFSWAPRAAQDGILRICRDSLSPAGVAQISYNVLPGWHMRSVIRDICLRHTGSEGSPQQRVAKARSILAELGASANASEPYGLLLRSEAQRIAHRPASYILGEFLVANNSPCYFADFVHRAADHDLAYVCECDLEAAVPEILSAKMQSQLRACAGADPLTIEQYGDYFTGRTLRSSLLTKTSGDIKRTRDYDQLRRLHIVSALRPEPGDTEATSYKDAHGRTIRSKDPAVQRALARLSAAYPQSLTLEQLAATQAGAPPEDKADAAAHICKALSLLVAAGQVDISTEPTRSGSASDSRPCVWAVARAEVTTGQPWLTNMAHAPVLLKPAMKVLLPHLDGTSDRTRLAQVFAQALLQGEVRIPELPGDSAQAPSAAIERLAADYVERVIDYLAANALLEPPA